MGVPDSSEDSEQILMANDTAVKLLGLSTEELVGQTLSSLCRTADAEAGLTAGAINGAFLDMPSSALTTREGDLVPVFGRLVDIKGGEVPATVSLWVYPLRGHAPPAPFSESLPANALHHDSESRFLVVMEPVQRRRGEMTLGPKGRVFSSDAKCGCVFGCHCESLLLGTPLYELIPTISKEELAEIKAPVTLSKAGLRRDTGSCFPLTIVITPDVDEDGEILKYSVEIEVVETISGVASLTQDGAIRSFNTHFSEALTSRPQTDLVHKHVTSLVPDFAVERVEACPAEGACSSEASTSEAAVNDVASRLHGLKLATKAPVSSPSPAKEESRADANANPVLPKPLEGVFKGHAVHKDGSLIPISYHIRRLQGGEGKRPHYCVWLLWQLEPPPAPPSPTSPSARDVKLSHHALDMWVGDECLGETCDGLMGCGQYADNYRTLSQIGKGAFGAVKLAVRRSDELLVVTKFICKAKVLSGAWVESPAWSERIPIELHLLSTLSHPNIVTVVDVFSNDVYYQLVMERHGSGMDLFEFIDREPKMDEHLVSHIFRQLVSAISYLDGKGVVHRDLKDENIIIDESFGIKLIDFGSAAFYKDGDVPFATFCGTLEYASPEILLGNRYRGPEAEIWSLGVLLFTLEFGEAPFQTPEETIEAAFASPWEVSEGLDHLLSWLLQPEPTLRASIKQIERHWWLLQPVDASHYHLQDVLSNAAPEEIAPLKYLNGRCPKGSETGSE